MNTQLSSEEVMKTINAVKGEHGGKHYQNLFLAESPPLRTKGNGRRSKLKPELPAPSEGAFPSPKRVTNLSPEFGK